MGCSSSSQVSVPARRIDEGLEKLYNLTNPPVYKDILEMGIKLTIMFIKFNNYINSKKYTISKYSQFIDGSDNLSLTYKNKFIFYEKMFCCLSTEFEINNNTDACIQIMNYFNANIVMDIGFLNVFINIDNSDENSITNANDEEMENFYQINPSFNIYKNLSIEEVEEKIKIFLSIPENKMISIFKPYIYGYYASIAANNVDTTTT